jgi:hypothetical protein
LFIAYMLVDMTWNWFQEEGWLERGECMQIDGGFWGRHGYSPYGEGFCR